MKKTIGLLLLCSQMGFAISAKEANALAKEGLNQRTEPLMQTAIETISATAKQGQFGTCVSAKGYGWDVEQEAERKLYSLGYFVDFYLPHCIWVGWR